MTKQMWKCRRCGEIVDMVNFRCGCPPRPSPWEPVTELTSQERDAIATPDQKAKAAGVSVDAYDKTGNYFDELTKLGIPTHKTDINPKVKASFMVAHNKSTPQCEYCYQRYDISDAAKHKDGKCNEICVDCGCPVHPCLPCEEVVLLNGNHTDATYKDLLKLILRDGRRKKNRTGIDTIGVFGAQAKFDVDLNAFPILTTKKVWFKGIVHELLWFLRGDTNIKYLVDNGVHIWDEWAYKRYADANKKVGGDVPFTQDNFVHVINTSPADSEFVQNWGELGEGTYGGMWRAFPFHIYEETEYSPEFDAVVKSVRQYDGGPDCGGCYTGTVDQIQKVMDKLKNNPDDRRMIVSAWHPYWAEKCALSPCHCFMQFGTEELTVEERNSYGINVLGQSFLDEKEMDEKGVPKRRLNLLMLIRSNDMFLGAPFNITSYSLLIAMVAHCVGMEPGTLTYTIGDCHLYVNHLEQVNEQLSRTPKVLPKLWLNPKVKDLFSFKYDDIKLIGYDSHPAIKGDVAV